MASSTEGLHVIIIGAGITGLLIAQGLKKTGVPYSIFEEEPSPSFPRAREWSMALHWSIPLLEDLLPDELREHLEEIQVDPSFHPAEKDELRVFDGTSGRIMTALPLPKTMRAQRQRMRAFCSRGIDVKYGHKLVDVTYGPTSHDVVAIFQNGQEIKGTTIVGSDGPHSKVRELLLGTEKARLMQMDNVVHCNVTAHYNDVEQAKFIRTPHPIFCTAFYPEIMLVQTMHDVPDPNNPTTWKFQYIFSWLGKPDHSLSNADRLAQVKEKGSVLCEPFRSAILWMPDDTTIRYNNLGYWIGVPWDTRNGRMTLAGDSAHPMPPHRGQGLNHAICDASNFVAAIKTVQDGKCSIDEAVTLYSSEVLTRGAAEVKNSVSNAEMVYHWDQLMEASIMQQALARGSVDN